jgi:hypothetical protein
MYRLSLNFSEGDTMRITIETDVDKKTKLPRLEGCEHYACNSCFYKNKEGCIGKIAYDLFFKQWKLVDQNE